MILWQTALMKIKIDPIKYWIFNTIQLDFQYKNYTFSLFYLDFGFFNSRSDSWPKIPYKRVTHHSKYPGKFAVVLCVCVHGARVYAIIQQQITLDF